MADNEIPAVSGKAGIPCAFTPGPWGLVSHNYGYDLVAQGSAPKGYGGWLVELHSGERPTDGPEFRELFEANARLISAAPDMFEALESVDDMFSNPGRINKNTVRDNVRAALAKARGDQVQS
jgi:hypothetical protein